MKAIRKFSLITLLTLIYLPSNKLIYADRLPAAYTEKKFSISLADVELSELLKLIAEQGGVKIEVDDAVKEKATYAFVDSTLEDALKQIAKDHKLIYYSDDGVIYVEKNESDGDGADSGSKGSGVFSIAIKNASAKTISEKLPKFFRTGESLIVDESTNSLIFYGSDLSRRKLLRFIDVLDQMPAQILIEAQIIETSKNFIRDIGFKWGEVGGNMKLGNSAVATGNINVPPATSPTFTAKFLLGWVDKRSIEAHVLAAEDDGKAKIISRPKVITLNNQAATINSGITYHVKTLSSTPSGSSTGSATAAGGVQSINAGLQLSILPLIVGKGLIRMQISVVNSTPDDSLAVDGIPAINDNSANTSIIVRDGKTAVIAGLIKSTLSTKSSRVPFLSSIPVLGWLFKSKHDKDLNSELVILISPQIILPDESQTPQTEARSDSGL